MLRKLPIVAVFGAGTPIDDERARLAQDVGVTVARLGAHLLTGAGYGVMAAVAEGFVSVVDRAGWSIGIVPREPDGAFDEPNHDHAGRIYPNPFVEIAIRTPLPPRVEHWRQTPARNHVNVLTADAIVALPGGLGTLNELDMALEYRDARGWPPGERSIILVGASQEFAPRHREQLPRYATPQEVERHLRRALDEARAAAKVGASP